jgi:hypothetical protein
LRKRFANIDSGWIVAVLLPLIGILPTFSGSGIIYTADGPLHVHRIFAMKTLLAQGNLWPRWIPWFHLGYGYPVFDLYPPGVFYAGGIMGLLGLSIPLASTLLSTLAWILGSVGTYGLARRFLPASGAILAAMLWTYAPSRLFEVWHQGSLPQTMAGSLLPWVLWGLVAAAMKPTRWNVVRIALPFAGVILCHQPITLMGGLFIGPAALVLPLTIPGYDRRTLLKRWGVTLGGLMLGVGLASIFLIPLALELRYVQANDQASDVIAYLTSNFLKPSELFIQPQPIDLTDLRLELPTTLGLVWGLLGALGLAGLIRRKQYRAALGLGAAMAFALFMMLEVSLPLWKIIPFMAQLRFPERLLRVAALFLALLGGGCILLLPEKWRTGGLALVLGIVLVSIMPMVYPTQKFIQWPGLSATDEIDMEIKEHNWGTTSYDEFNPIWGQKPGWDTNLDSYEAYRTDPTRISVNIIDQMKQAPDLKVEPLGGATNRLTLVSPRPVHFRQFYFPGWTATLDGQPAEIYPEDEVGAITMDVPAGEHIITLTYTGTPAQATGALVTLVSIGIVGVLVYPRRKSVPETTEPAANTLRPRLAGALIGTVAVIALVNTYMIAPDTLFFRAKSPPDAPIYMQTPVNVTFGGVFELLGYTLKQDHVAPDGLLDIVLFWRATAVLDREYTARVQLVNLPASAAWASSQPFSPGGGSTANGYPLDRFASELHELRVYPDAPPYAGRISVQMMDVAARKPLTLPDGTDRLILPPLIRLDGMGADLPHSLNYHFEPGIELWCVSVQPDGNNMSVELGWHVSATPNTDMNLFLHGLDAEGNLVEQQDSAPLGAEYPPTLWLPGQNLSRQYSLPANPAITQVALGLYIPGGDRLPATQEGQPVPDNRVILPVGEGSCGS